MTIQDHMNYRKEVRKFLESLAAGTQPNGPTIPVVIQIAASELMNAWNKDNRRAVLGRVKNIVLNDNLSDPVRQFAFLFGMIIAFEQ